MHIILLIYNRNSLFKNKYLEGNFQLALGSENSDNSDRMSN